LVDAPLSSKLLTHNHNFLMAIDTEGDLPAMHLLSYPGVEVDASDIGELTRLADYTVIRNLYFMKSKRVKAAFTRRQKNRTPLQGDEDVKRDVIPPHAC
jgi:hypothetical protein